jgi:hypothetical protein
MDTDTKSFVRKLMFYQFGLYAIVSLFTMMVMTVIVSGDSMTPNGESTTVQSITNNWVTP